MKPTKADNKKTKKKRFKYGFVLLLFLIIAGGLTAGVFYFKDQYESSINNSLSESKEVITFVVDEGESLDQIIEKLITEKIIEQKDSLYLQLYLKVNDLEGSIKVGSFQIPRDLTMIELIETLQSADISEIWITIPEGLRYDEIADILNNEFSQHEESSFSREKFIQLVEDPTLITELELNGDPINLEGFLFPDKYLLPLRNTEEDIIQSMILNFNNKVGNEYTYEDIIMASLLEKEGRTDKERKMISDIIDRRIKEGWFLKIDATLLYNFKDWGYELTIEDIDTDSPFNTHTRIGLPPTPIGNPSLNSIKAALSPTPNNYYYYLHDTDGIIHYSKTFEEHSENINNYLQ